jgi:transposase-like protein
MRKKGYTPAQIIGKLRKADVLSSQGLKVEEICRKLGVSDVTYYRWRKEYGGMQIEQAKRLKDLEKENNRLKNLVAELNLDKAILEEALKGNY